MMQTLTDVLGIFIIIYMLLIILFYILMMVVAYNTLARRKRLDHDCWKTSCR